MINAQLNQRLMVNEKIGHYMYHAVSSLHCNAESRQETSSWCLDYLDNWVMTCFFLRFFSLSIGRSNCRVNESLLLLKVPL